MSLQRLDKLMAATGRWSRREAKELIRQGRVLVNGLPARSGEEKADPEAAAILVDGTDLGYSRFTYVMLNKPAGVLSATEDPRQGTVLDLLAPELRRRGLFPVGRLDKDTEGLLLLTDDGELAHKMLAPKSHVYKQYRAQLDAPVEEADIQAFAAGVAWEGEQYAPARLWVEQDPRAAFVEIREGRFHQVKRMFQARGKTVLQLKRLKIGGLWLDSTLQEGECRLLTPQEIQVIFH